ncbi:MAG: alpha/beta hydrolase [Nocardioides sp.]|uniref:alpha/beta fold hydrolase n=1 Tax=Nocardioides sp. TaxID=35761 RepID=UPI0039E320B6
MGDSNRDIRVTLPSGLCIAGSIWAGQDDRLPVVLLHGGGQTRRAWRHTARRVAEAGYPAYTFDARGHGESDWASDGDYSLDAFVADLQFLLTTIDQPPVLVGASLGGTTSILAEHDTPGLTSGIVLADVAFEPHPDGKQRIYDFLNANLDGFDTIEEAAAAITGYNAAERRETGGNLDGLKRSLRQTADGRWHWHWDPRFARTSDGELLDHTDPARMRRAAPTIKPPVLVVRGDRSDVVSETEAEEMASTFPHARAVAVDSGHMITGDDNHVFSAELLHFLAVLWPSSRNRLDGQAPS